MIYKKPEIEKEGEKLPPITTNFAPPPVEGPFDSKSSIKKKVNQKKVTKTKKVGI